jgi:4'-phosphopantetheinyl transferase
LLQFLPQTAAKRAARYRRSQDAYNFVLGRLLLRQALIRSNLPLRYLEILEYTDAGKPVLPNLYFSISHSQNWVGCAFSTEQAVGLDLEVPRSLEKNHFRSSFSLHEWDLIDADDGFHTFYQYWTAKEAVLKAAGLGLMHLLDMTLLELKEAYVKLPKETQASRWQLQPLELKGSSAYACLCAEWVGGYAVERVEPSLVSV